jgi:hypothetical protein
MSEMNSRQRFRTTQQMAMVAKSWDLKGEHLGRFLRENGISSVELESWRGQMKDGMDDGKPLDRGTRKRLEQRIQLLEAELKRALGIIELQKKAQKIWEEDEARKVAVNPAASSSKPSKKE